MTVDDAVERALCELDFPSAADALVDAINDSYWDEVQSGAADYLWRSRQFPAVVEEWRTLSPQTDPQRHARLTTAINLVERDWGDVQECIDFQRRKVVDIITFDSYIPRHAPQRAAGQDVEAVQAAISLLTEGAPRFDGSYGDGHVVEMEVPPGFAGAEPRKIEWVLQPDTGGERRYIAAELLTLQGGQPACDALVHALDDADELVRACAAEGLAQLRYTAATPALVSALFREIDCLARSQMIESIALLDVNAVVHALRSPFDATDELVRKAIFGLAFSGLTDHPVPVSSRRPLLPTLTEITELANG